MFRATNKITCEVHKDTNIIEDVSSGDVCCGECGLVLVERCVDASCEWRRHDDEMFSSKQRVVFNFNDDAHFQNLTDAFIMVDKTRVGTKFLNNSTSFKKKTHINNNVITKCGVLQEVRKKHNEQVLLGHVKNICDKFNLQDEFKNLIYGLYTDAKRFRVNFNNLDLIAACTILLIEDQNLTVRSEQVLNLLNINNKLNVQRYLKELRKRNIFYNFLKKTNKNTLISVGDDVGGVDCDYLKKNTHRHSYAPISSTCPYNNNNEITNAEQRPSHDVRKIFLYKDCLNKYIEKYNGWCDGNWHDKLTHDVNFLAKKCVDVEMCTRIDPKNNKTGSICIVVIILFFKDVKKDNIKVDVLCDLNGINSTSVVYWLKNYAEQILAILKCE